MYYTLLIIIVGYSDSIVKNFVFFPEALTRKSKTNGAFVLEYKVAFLVKNANKKNVHKIALSYDRLPLGIQTNSALELHASLN